MRCLASDALFRDPLERGHAYAAPAARRTWRLTSFDSAEVAVVTDPAVCARVSAALGPVPPGPDLPGRRRPAYSDVVVVRLGRAGYLVHAYWHVFNTGEFLCSEALMAPTFGKARWVCG